MHRCSPSPADLCTNRWGPPHPQPSTPAPRVLTAQSAGPKKKGEENENTLHSTCRRRHQPQPQLDLLPINRSAQLHLSLCLDLQKIRSMCIPRCLDSRSAHLLRCCGRRWPWSHGCRIKNGREKGTRSKTARLRRPTPPAASPVVNPLAFLAGLPFPFPDHERFQKIHGLNIYGNQPL